MYFQEEILRKGFQQKMAYTVIKRGIDATLEEDPMKWFHKLQTGYQTSAIYCQNNVIDYAKKIIKRKGGNIRQMLNLKVFCRSLFLGSSEEISSNLSNIYPWLRWAVGKRTDETSISGNNYFEFHDSVKNRTIVVLWQDKNIPDEHAVDSLDGKAKRNISEMCSDGSECMTCNQGDVFSIR